MAGGTYLIFGDLHGRVLPAFALAHAWQQDHGECITALLQVGDLGYFPFPDRLDRATLSTWGGMISPCWRLVLMFTILTCQTSPF